MTENLATFAERFRGKFIVFDGVDGSGKSTQRERVAGLFREVGLDVQLCHDPGGTPIGDRIRSVLLDFDLSTMDVNCETLLFMASRAQLVSEAIRPALEAGKTVLCDRFVTSTCAYQGAAGDDPHRVIQMAQFAIAECWPHLTVILDVDADQGFERIGRKPRHAGKHRRRIARKGSLFDKVLPDAMEARLLSFHRRVRKNFLSVGEYYPTPVVVVDGRGDVDAVHQRILEALSSVTPRHRTSISRTNAHPAGHP